MGKEWDILKGYEKVMKGVANARRIEILILLTKRPEMSLTEITTMVGGDMRTISEHARKLALAGLISKKGDGTSVKHQITELGSRVLKFVKTL